MIFSFTAVRVSGEGSAAEIGFTKVFALEGEVYVARRMDLDGSDIVVDVSSPG